MVGVCSFNPAFELWAGCFNEFVVLHTGRAGGDTCHTTKTRIKVSREVCRDVSLTFECHFHKMNAATWRVCLSLPECIRRACGETKPTVYAISEKVSRWRLVRVESTGLGCHK